MQNACMPVNITIRNVPDNVREALASRAALEGQSMQEFLRAELIRMTSKPSNAEWVARVQEQKRRYEKTRRPITTEQIVALIREDRDR